MGLFNLPEIAFQDFSNNSMVPENPSVINRREASIALGEVTAGVPAPAIQTYAVTVATGTLYIVGGTGIFILMDQEI